MRESAHMTDPAKCLTMKPLCESCSHVRVRRGAVQKACSLCLRLTWRKKAASEALGARH